MDNREAKRVAGSRTCYLIFTSANAGCSDMTCNSSGRERKSVAYIARSLGSWSRLLLANAGGIRRMLCEAGEETGMTKFTGGSSCRFGRLFEIT